MVRRTLWSHGARLLGRRPAERHGGRVVLVALAWLVVAAGVLLATARVPALVVLAAMLGNVAVSHYDLPLWETCRKVAPVSARERAG